MAGFPIAEVRFFKRFESLADVLLMSCRLLLDCGKSHKKRLRSKHCLESFLFLVQSIFDWLTLLRSEL